MEKIGIIRYPRQEAFCQAYVRCHNAAMAAREAGYPAKSSHTSGYHNLKRPHVQKRIAEIKAELNNNLNFNEGDWKREVLNIARANMKNYANVTQDGVTMKPTDDMSHEDAAAIKEVSVTESNAGVNLKYKLKDSVRAYEMLGRSLGVYKDNVKVEVTDNSKIAMEAWAKRKEERETERKEERAKKQ